MKCINRRRSWLSRALVLGCLCLMQCSAPQPVPMQAWFDQAPPDVVSVDPRFRDGLGKLAVAQSWAAATEPPRYDWILLGVRAQWDGEEGVWFVRVAEVVDPEEAEGGRKLRDRRFQYTLPFGVGEIEPDARFTVRCRRLRIETYDANGEFVAAWSRLVPEIFPQASLYQALATLPEPGPFGSRTPASAAPLPPSTVAEQRLLRDCGVYELISTLQALGTTPPMTPIRDVVKDHIVSVPSIVSLVLTGLKPSAEATMSTATSAGFPWVFQGAMAPCYQAEFSTYFAGERCFDCRVVVAPSVPPMHLLGGLLVIEAVHPRYPDNRLSARVLATSRVMPSM